MTREDVTGERWVEHSWDGIPGVLPIGWNDPASRNAIGAERARLIGTTLAKAAEPGVRVVLLGAGQTPFCSGWDVRDLAGLDRSSRDGVRAYFEPGRELMRALAECPVPVVAAVSGVALGFGCSLLAQADLVLADEEAQFGLPEIARGFPPATVMPELLEVMPARAVGAWALTGARHDAQRASMAGLVHRVAPKGSLDALLTDVLTDLTNLDGGVMRAAKALLRSQRDLPLQERRANGVAAAVDLFAEKEASP